MDFSMEDSQNSAPGQPTMAEQQKIAAPARKTDTLSVTKRYFLKFREYKTDRPDISF